MTIKDFIHRLIPRTPALSLNQQIQAERTRRIIRKAAAQGRRGPAAQNPWTTGPEEDSTRSTRDESIIRAIHSLNSRYGIMGLPRENFSMQENDRLADNAVFSVAEKATLDYFGPAEYEVKDDKGKEVGTAMDFLMEPNPQQTLNDIILETIPDTLRYDQAIWVKGLNAWDQLLELKAYKGPEFWIEIDREWRDVEGEYGAQYVGPWSRGYVRRYWQHSRPGIYVPFLPKEICHFKLYPRSDSVYGTDFLARLKWLLEYLRSSTKAAGMTFENGVAPGAIWKHPQYMSIEQLEEREIEVEIENKGADAFGGILHLIGDESIESFTPTLLDMQWLEGQRYVSEIVWAMFGFTSSEFTSGDVNRATAYINRNITKSRMLYRLQRSFENMLNRRVLPLLPGYQKGWKFEFLDAVDLDDELKRAQITGQKIQNAQAATTMGISVESALQLAEVDDDLRTAIVEDLQNLSQDEAWDRGLPAALSPEEAEQYYGNQPAPDVEDYQGTPDADLEELTDHEDRPGLQKAGGTIVTLQGEVLKVYEAETIEKAETVLEVLDSMAAEMPAGLEILAGPGILKARKYLGPGQEAPAGVEVRTGPKGGQYYETTGRSTKVRESAAAHLPTSSGPIDRPGPRPEGSPSARPRLSPEEWQKRVNLAILSGNFDQVHGAEGEAVGPGWKYTGRFAVDDDDIVVPEGDLWYRDEDSGRWSHVDPETFHAYMRRRELKTPVEYSEDFDDSLNLEGTIIAPQDYETLVIIDQDGNDLLRKDGGHNHVAVSAEEAAPIAGGYATHNHPSGGSFSPDDIHFACHWQLREIRAATTEREFVVRPKEGQGAFLPKDWQEINARCQFWNHRIHAHFFSRIREGTLSVEQANHAHWDQVWAHVAEDTGLIRYMVRPLDPGDWTPDQRIGKIQHREENHD